MSFAKPTSASGIKWADLKGALLIIEPLSIETAIKTVHGESDAVKANVYVVDGPNAGDEYRDTLIFPKVLQSAVRGSIGSQVLGRLGTGNAKPGQSAPWMLDDFTDADVTAAEAYLAKNMESPF